MEKGSVVAEQLRVQELENQLYEQQKQIRSKEALFKKDKAVLEQKLELLELQAVESRNREKNLKEMYEKMLAALRPENEESGLVQELSLAKELHKKEIEIMRTRYAEDVKELQQQLLESKNSIISNSKMSIINEEEIRDQLNREWEEKLEVQAEKNNKMIEVMELEYKAKLKSANLLLEKEKMQHQQEIDQLQKKLQNALNNSELLSTHKKELLNIQKAFEKFRNIKQEEIETLRKQRDEAVRELQQAQLFLTQAEAVDPKYDLPLRICEDKHPLGSARSKQVMDSNLEFTVEAVERIPRSELRVLKECQNVLLAVTKMECRECHSLIEADNFLEHLESCPGNRAAYFSTQSSVPAALRKGAKNSTLNQIQIQKEDFGETVQTEAALKLQISEILEKIGKRKNSSDHSLDMPTTKIRRPVSTGRHNTCTNKASARKKGINRYTEFNNKKESVALPCSARNPSTLSLHQFVRNVGMKSKPLSRYPTQKTLVDIHDDSIDLGQDDNIEALPAVSEEEDSFMYSPKEQSIPIPNTTLRRLNQFASNIQF